MNFFPSKFTDASTARGRGTSQRKTTLKQEKLACCMDLCNSRRNRSYNDIAEKWLCNSSSKVSQLQSSFSRTQMLRALCNENVSLTGKQGPAHVGYCGPWLGQTTTQPLLARILPNPLSQSCHFPSLDMFMLSAVHSARTMFLYFK